MAKFSTKYWDSGRWTVAAERQENPCTGCWHHIIFLELSEQLPHGELWRHLLMRRWCLGADSVKLDTEMAYSGHRNGVPNVGHPSWSSGVLKMLRPHPWSLSLVYGVKPLAFAIYKYSPGDSDWLWIPHWHLGIICWIFRELSEF